MIPMRLVSLEKGKLASTSYFYSYYAGLLTISSSLLRSLSTKPSSSANLTRAISSGLEACKTLTPSSVTGVTLLHRMRAVARSRCRNYCLLLAFFFILHSRVYTVKHRADLPKDLQIFCMLWRYLSLVSPYRQLYREFRWGIVFWRPYRYRSAFLFYHWVNTLFCLVIQVWSCFCRLFQAGEGRCWFCKRSMFYRNPDWLSDWLVWYWRAVERIWRSTVAIEGWIIWRRSWRVRKSTSVWIVF